MEPDQDQAYAYFWIAGFDCDFSEITRLMGLEPTRAANRAHNSRRGARNESYWDLYGPTPRRDLLMDHHLEALVGLIEPKKQILGHLRDLGYRIGINCAGYFSGNPGFHLSAELIIRCAGLGLSVDFDLYCLTDCES